MRAWDVNWEVKQLRLQFEEEDFQVRARPDRGHFLPPNQSKSWWAFDIAEMDHAHSVFFAGVAVVSRLQNNS